ncbi:MAG: M23 family metallopeptidase [Acidimicrobiales bacterium]
MSMPRCFSVVVGLGLLLLIAGCGADPSQDSANPPSVSTDEAESSLVATTLGSESLVASSLTTTSEADTTPLDSASSSTAALEVSTSTVPSSTSTSQTTAETTAQPTTVPSTTAPSTTESTVQATTPPTEVDPSTSVAEVAATARTLVVQEFAVMATFAEVTLLHPSNRVERVGFHESNNDGARQLEPSDTVVGGLVLESRQRDTGSRTAADVVVEPGTEIRAPVTGTVLRAGGYVLYCKHSDDFVVIEPDSHPGWELKVLHINGVMVSAGDRVEAGVTVLAPAATLLPFDSQVDEFTAEPSWPHVHIELVDPSIPDRPSPGGGC